MQRKDDPSGISFIKSPFLVVKRLDHGEVRVYSKLVGNLTSFNCDVQSVLDRFDAPQPIEAAIQKVPADCHWGFMSLIRELRQKQFIVEAAKTEKALFSEYVERWRHQHNIPKISNITFLISAKCNLTCTGCYHNFYGFKNTDMSSDLADQIIEGIFPYLKRREIPSLIVSFLGYEPLLKFQTLCDIYTRARKAGEMQGIKTKCIIYTNGFHLPEEFLPFIQENTSQVGIKVSIDGIKEDHDKRRVDSAGNGSYERVIENLRRIRDTGVECGVLTVLSRLNFNHIEQFVDEMAALGIKNVTANLYCGQSEEERRLELTEDEKFQAIQRMDLSTESHGIKFDGEWKYAVLQMFSGAEFSCPAGTRQLVFSADGAIYPCQRFAGTGMNFGIYHKDFWKALTDRRCEGYNCWTTEIHEGGMERTKAETIDLAGWSCPFLSFMRGKCLHMNLERRLNEYLLDYYLTRPLGRIRTD